MAAQLGRPHPWIDLDVKPYVRGYRTGSPIGDRNSTGPVTAGKPGIPGQSWVIPGLIEDPRTIAGAEITAPAGALDEARFNAPAPPPLQATVPRVALLLPSLRRSCKIGKFSSQRSSIGALPFRRKGF